jgi:signal transduction histidine kinase
MNIDNDLPKILIDKNRIIEVFINIILNAIQAIDGAGKITISTKLIKLVKAISDMDKIEIVKSDYPQVDIQEILLKKGSKVIELEISDTGQGMNSNIIDQIFDPFFTTKINGTGLGLSLVKNVINKHGGIIQVQNQVKKGNKFTIYLPVN